MASHRIERYGHWPQRSRLIAAPVLATMLALLLAVLVVGSCQRRGEPEPANRPGEELRNPPTRRSAVAAATRFLTQLDLRLLLDERQRRSVITSWAAPESSAALLAVYEAEAARLAQAYAATPRVARSALLGYRVENFSPPSARVSIWSLGVGGAGHRDTAVGWATTTVAIRWLGTRWGIVDVAQRRGPSGGSPVRELARAAGGFTAYRYAP